MRFAQARQGRRFDRAVRAVALAAVIAMAVTLVATGVALYRHGPVASGAETAAR